MKILECLRDGEKCICEIVPAIKGEQSNISRHISLMQKTHLVSTRKEGVRVMVKVNDPKVFEILNNIGLLLKKQIMETGKLVQQLK
jgi:ArsR family transcriptional regulator